MGFFTGDYESAGVGISKHAPKKTGIALFFDILGRKFWKLFEINLLYSVFYIPLVLSITVLFVIDNTAVGLALSIILGLIFAITVGPATAGMTKVMRNYVLEKHSFIFRDFFKGFKDNFKKAAVIGFVDVLICVSVAAGFLVYPALAEQYGKAIYAALILSLSVAIVILMMNFYIFLMLIATDLSLKNLLKNSFALAFVELKTSFLTFIIFVAIVVLVAILPIFVSFSFLLILPFFPAAFLSFIICFNSYPVIQKYVINPYYTALGQVNPELRPYGDDDDDEEPIFEDMGGKEKPIEKRKKGKGKRIS